MHSSRAAALLFALCAAWTLPSSAATPLPPACPPIALAGADAAAVRTPSSADAWGGARTGNEATLSDRVVAYSIDA